MQNYEVYVSYVNQYSYPHYSVRVDNEDGENIFFVQLTPEEGKCYEHLNNMHFCSDICPDLVEKLYYLKETKDKHYKAVYSESGNNSELVDDLTEKCELLTDEILSILIKLKTK